MTKANIKPWLKTSHIKCFWLAFSHDFIFAFVILDQIAQNLAAFHWTDLFINKRSVFGNSKLEHIAFHKFAFRSVIGRNRVLLTIRTHHILTVKNSLNYLAAF